MDKIFSWFVMVGFSPHFAIGMMSSLPFVWLDKKSRYKTLVVGGFAATLPDIDFPGVFVDWIEHRGAIHKFPTWLVASIIVMILIFFLIGWDYWKHDLSISFEAYLDKMIYFGAFTIGWASHVFVDFGFTKYGGREASIFLIPDEFLPIMDQGAGFIVALVLGLIIWWEINDKDRELKSEAGIIINQKTKEYKSSQGEESIRHLQDILEQLFLIKKFRVPLDQLEESIRDGLKDYRTQIEEKCGLKYKIEKDVIIFIHKPRFKDFGLTSRQKILINFSLFIVFFIVIGIIVGLFD